jgi:hypothetical protein
MAILKDIPVRLSAEEVADSLNRGRAAAPRMIEQTREAVAMAEDLWDPAVVYDWINVESVSEERVRISAADGGAGFLDVGPHADLLAEAEIALASVHSIGPRLDERVRELNRKGDILLGYLLDSVGVAGLGKVGEAVRTLAEEEAVRRGWGVGACLSPGSIEGWPLEGQGPLCSLLPIEAAGITLGSTHILVPFKSVSGLIGLGPGYRSGKVGSVCRFCMHAATCWRRRKDAEVKRT